MPRAVLSPINELRLLNAFSGRCRLFHPVAWPAFCAHLPAHLKEVALYGHSIKVFGEEREKKKKKQGGGEKRKPGRKGYSSRPGNDS